MFSILLLAIFLTSLAVVGSGLYFFVETPMARRQIRTRLTAVREVEYRHDEVPDLLKKELLSDLPWLNRALGLMPGITPLRLYLQQAGLRMQLGTFALLVVAVNLLGFLTGLMLNFPFIYCVLAGAGSALLPCTIVGILRSRRLVKFDEQFPECIDLLARSVRAGHAFTTGFEMIGKEFSDPLGEEFRMTYRQQNLGLPLRDALANLTVRIPSKDVSIFVSALQIQRECGGNLGEILDMLSYVIRERFKLQRQIRTFTAEGRLSMYMLSGIPILAVVGLSIFNPVYLQPLLTDPRGHTAIAAGVILQVIGYLVISKIIKIKV